MTSIIWFTKLSIINKTITFQVINVVKACLTLRWYVIISNHREWQHSRLVALWLQLVNQNIVDINRTYWQFGPLANFHCDQPKDHIPTTHLKEDQVALQWRRLVLFYQTKLNHECSNIQKRLTFQPESHDSTTFSNLQPPFTSAKPNRVRNQSLGSIHTSEQRSATVTASTVLSIKTGRNGLMLVEKQTSPLTKPRPIAGRISYTVLCQTLTGQMYGRSFKASIEHQIPTDPMKPCLITTEQSPTPGPRLTPSSTIAPGLASSAWQKRIVISIAFSKNASTLHLSTTKAAPPSTCLNYCQQFRTWNAKELLVQMTFHQHSSNHLVL